MDISKVKRSLLEKERKTKLIKQAEKDRIIEKLKSIRSIWKKFGIEKVYLYGSCADMTLCRYSDIDIAVEPAIPFESLLSLFSEIDRQTTRRIDVRNLSELPFSQKVKREGVLVYDRKNCNT
jgi:predicted nucleotidyltransferase